MRKRKGPLLPAMALALLCLAGCAGQGGQSPTAAYDGTWYFAKDGAQCVFADSKVYRDDKTAPSGQTLAGLYEDAGDHIDANLADTGGVEVTRTLYIVDGDLGQTLCDSADGSGTVYFYRDPLEVLSVLDRQETEAETQSVPPLTQPEEQAPAEGEGEAIGAPAEVVALEPTEPDGAAGPESRAVPTAQPEGAEQPTPTAQIRTSGNTVWIPQSGSKYHSSPTCSGMKNPTKTSLSDALSRGYTACKRCH